MCKVEKVTLFLKSLFQGYLMQAPYSIGWKEIRDCNKKANIHTIKPS